MVRRVRGEGRGGEGRHRGEPDPDREGMLPPRIRLPSACALLATPLSVPLHPLHPLQASPRRAIRTISTPGTPCWAAARRCRCAAADYPMRNTPRTRAPRIQPLSLSLSLSPPLNRHTAVGQRKRQLHRRVPGGRARGAGQQRRRRLPASRAAGGGRGRAVAAAHQRGRRRAAAGDAAPHDPPPRHGRHFPPRKEAAARKGNRKGAQAGQ